MKCYPPSEFVTEEEVPEILRRTLVLCPAFERPAVPTQRMLDQLEQLGASLLLSNGVSDIALHRNLIAGEAYKLVLEHGDHFESVLWIDADIVGTPADCAALCKIARVHEATITGLYCIRKDPHKFACKLLANDPFAPASSPIAHRPSTIELLPAFSGMGCMAHFKNAFVKACNEADWFTLRGRAKAPAICQSRIGSYGIDGAGDWLSEDLFFSRHLWTYTAGLYLAPIEFGHLAERMLLPDPSAMPLE